MQNKNNFSHADSFWMQQAIDLAKQAALADEVPVGAVIVLDEQIIGSGFNQPISAQDPTAHAEIIAIRNAAKTIENYRLINATLYVTLEPCVMCAGAMQHARIHRLVYGAADQKYSGSVRTNHDVIWEGGLLAEPCAQLLRDFFQARR